MEAAGPTQSCRGDSFFVVFLEIEAGLIRMELSLPDVTAYTDLAAAHDTAWPEKTTVALHDVGQIHGEELVMAHQLQHGTEVSVVDGDDRSRWVSLTGLPEGRRNASTFFAILASAFPRSLADRYVGVGLNPPEDAVIAYHMTKEGTTGACPDLAWCRQTVASIRRQEVAWGDAMRAAASDAARLCLLDCASTVEVGLLQYSDDNKVKGSSDGMLDVAVSCLAEAVTEIRGEQRYGPGKGEFMVRQLPPQPPRGAAKQCAVHKGLGAPIDAALRLTPLLRQVEERGVHSWRSLLCAAEGLGLPPEVLLTALRKRVEPKSTYAALFLVVRPDWQKRRDAMQDRWIMSLLSLERKVARATLMAEVGISSRLSTRVMAHAFGLLARIRQLPGNRLAAQVAALAEQHPLTWTSTVVSLMKNAGVLDFLEWRARGPGAPAEQTDKQARKREMHKYKEDVVKPAMVAYDDQWRRQQKARTASFVLVDVVSVWWPLSVVRAWAQLRLQGFISMPEGVDSNECPLCSRTEQPDVRHLFLQCPGAQSTICGAVKGTSWADVSGAERLERFRMAGTMGEARIAAGIASALRKKMWRQKKLGNDDSDTSAEDEIGTGPAPPRNIGKRPWSMLHRVARCMGLFDFSGAPGAGHRVTDEGRDTGGCWGA
jgi:hypothetical protein